MHLYSLPSGPPNLRMIRLSVLWRIATTISKRKDTSLRHLRSHRHQLLTMKSDGRKKRSSSVCWKCPCKIGVAGASGHSTVWQPADPRLPVHLVQALLLLVHLQDPVLAAARVEEGPGAVADTLHRNIRVAMFLRVRPHLNANLSQSNINLHKINHQHHPSQHIRHKVPHITIPLTTTIQTRPMFQQTTFPLPLRPPRRQQLQLRLTQL